jgi:Flp pilus assembly protein TadB
MQRKHFLAIRIALVAGFLLVGVTLHHHGATYNVIRVIYIALIVGLIVWRIRVRRSRRRSRS